MEYVCVVWVMDIYTYLGKTSGVTAGMIVALQPCKPCRTVSRQFQVFIVSAAIAL